MVDVVVCVVVILLVIVVAIAVVISFDVHLSYQLLQLALRCCYSRGRCRCCF